MKAKRNKKRKAVSVLLFAVVLIMLFFSKQRLCWLVLAADQNQTSEKSNENQDQTTEVVDEALAEDESQAQEVERIEHEVEMRGAQALGIVPEIVEEPVLTAEDIINEQRANLPAEMRLEVPTIYQAPELPTGCESVALTMALNYHGFGLEKTTIANEYLIYNNSNFADGYMGSPFSSEGAGIFPPGLANTANDFFRSQGSDMTAHNISGTGFSDLYAYVAAGYPVLIWTTMYYDSPMFEQIYVESGGRSYQWYLNEHCVVLGGYNQNQNTVTLFDSLQGEIVLDASAVQSIYDAVGQCAVAMY